MEVSRTTSLVAASHAPVQLVAFTTNHGLHFEGRVVAMSAGKVGFELCGPEQVVSISDVLEDFELRSETRALYRGTATITSAVALGPVTVCEATLGTGEWDLDGADQDSGGPKVNAAVAGFVKGWNRYHRIKPDYKLAVVDLESLLIDLQRCLTHLELRLRSEMNGNYSVGEKELLRACREEIWPILSGAFERFECAAGKVGTDLFSIHTDFCRRILHPLLLCSPFMYRIYAKPLGYAGDYEMVNMILRDPYEGRSLFAKILNVFILDQVPASAHRNRIDYLVNALVKESCRCQQSNKTCRILNFGCGPAAEVQKFMAEHPVSSSAAFTLLDTNDETLQFAQNAIASVARTAGRSTSITLVKKTVQQFLKGGARADKQGTTYDLIYCAGLFDYLNDRICRMLIEQSYRMLHPGGSLVITNVDRANPIRNIMEHIFAWFLVYRSADEVVALADHLPAEAETSAQAEMTSSNVFLTVRKPLTHR